MLTRCLTVLTCVAVGTASADVLKDNAVEVAAIRSCVIKVIGSGLGASPTCASGLLGHPAVSLSPKVRAAIVVAALDVAKTLAATPELQGTLVAAAPNAFVQDPRTRFVELERDLNARLAALVGADMKKVPEADRRAVEVMQEKATSSVRKLLDQQRAGLPEAIKKYEAKRAEYELHRPPDATVVHDAMGKLLGEFLANTQDIPWSAKLVSRDGRHVFLDPRLEAKPRWWKACFRAGQEPVDAARAYVTRWRAELK